MDEIGWLIEAKTPEGQPCYWGGPALWTIDHLRAIRFVRKLDGERVLEDLDYDQAVVVQHMWCPPPLDDAKTGAALGALVSATISDIPARTAALETALSRMESECRNELVRAELEGCDPSGPRMTHWRELQRMCAANLIMNADALLSPAPAQPAMATKCQCDQFDEPTRTAPGAWHHPQCPLSTKVILPIGSAKLTPMQAANGKRDVAFEDAAENEAPSPAATKEGDE